MGVVLAFILAGTVINPAVLPMAIAMLGPELTAAYAATAVIGPLVVGIVANVFGGTNVLGRRAHSSVDLYRAELTAGPVETIELIDLDELEPPGLWERLRASFKWGFQDLAVGMSGYLILGFGLAGLAASYISCNPSAILGQFFGEPGWAPLLMTAGISSIVYI